MKVQVFDPPMCCPTGICGPAIKPELVCFAADLEWLGRQGVEVERYNVSQQPAAFANNPVVREALETDGNACLPLTLVNRQVACKGRYPSREELASLSGLNESGSGVQDKPAARRSPCCAQSPPDKEEPSDKKPNKGSSCCSG